METVEQKEKFTRSLTFKAMIVMVLTLLLLIPGAMIQGLISERQELSHTTIASINEKWSLAQTLCPPVLVIPYTTTVREKDKATVYQEHEWHITPENTKIDVRLFPEERHQSIYKSIVYKSNIHIDGNFEAIPPLHIDNSVLHFDRAYIVLGISDLRGISEAIDFEINGKKYPAEAKFSRFLNQANMSMALKDAAPEKLLNGFSFNCILKLKGSGSISFIPVAKTTKVNVSGNWTAPGFFGNFLPDYKVDDKDFNAEWNILNFNRRIPERWIDNEVGNLHENELGVSLINMVDHYRQNMRSAKYALLFIGLTFVVFFFVEALTEKRIHPVQYTLAGIALILFYSLLLSISEQIGFVWAYLIASTATISLITVYAHCIFKDKKPTAILALILIALYIFLFVVLQLEDMALLIGSVGLFLILGIIMFVSRTIKWH
ncbi:MAG: cell envelope integrity protein CreD [Dysgonamonadaceae bacterium]|jgi:inner membrane protein|nr:cell envelope integrity protein CreD [Dysgonamonadaceae bacterium]